MTDPAEIGRRVLKALARGRARRLADRLEKAEQLRDLVLRAARLDRAAGRATRGQAGRIARRLQCDGMTVSERHVRQIIRNCGTDSSAQHGSPVVLSPPASRSTR